MKNMKKMDEMERHIMLLSQSYGYRAAVLTLALWTICKSTLALVKNTAADPLPVVLMWIPMAVQWISQEVLTRRMTAGDEEYRAPNTALRVAIAAVVLGAFLAALGTYVFILLR